MTIVSGNLTLPNQLTVQGWLAQFFNGDLSAYGFDEVINNNILEINAPPATIFGFPEGKVTVTLDAFGAGSASAGERNIQFIIIEDGSGKSMQIQLVNPLPATTYAATLAGGAGAQDFYDLLLPNPEIQFFHQEGSPGNDNILGFASDDFLFGNGGDDIIFGGKGDDDVQGGPGLDTAGFSGNRSSFTLLFVEDGTRIQDRRPDGDGLDRLDGIETLTFEGDADADLDLFSVAVGLAKFSDLPIDELAKSYMAYSDTLPTVLELVAWAAALDESNAAQAIKDTVSDVVEVIDLAALGETSTDIVEAVYGMLLGRPSDAEGQTFWESVVDSGTLEDEDFISAFLQGTEAPPPDTLPPGFLAQQLADQDYINEKVDIAIEFALMRGMTSETHAATVYGQIDGTASGFENARNAIDTLYQEALDPEDGTFLLDVPLFKDGFEAM